MIHNKLKKNLKKCQSSLKQEKTEAFRLYDMDIPEYPFIIDVYKNHVIIWPKSNPKIDGEKKHHLDETIEALKKIFLLTSEHIHIKDKSKQKGPFQYKKLNEKKQSLTIKENDISYLINLSDYLDVGLFLDHRPMRKWLKKNKTHSKSLLNLFSYTCSISVAAASSGHKTTNVDLSKTYLEWGQENFTLNNLDIKDHQFIKMSVIDFLNEKALSRSVLEEGHRYDIIFLDPPTFSNSKSMKDKFEVEDDQLFLIKNCMKLLKEEGVLYFSNNKKTFKLKEEIFDQFNIKDISLKSIPLDFRNKKIHQLFEIKHL